ncbi:hypothetical protein DFH05DRAFT_1397812, partial [Lentinula detonsa]
MPLEEKKRAARNKPTPYNRQPQKANTPRTSATSALPSRKQHLTLYDKLTILDYANKHPSLPQDRICKYFATRQEGALIFTQSTLSRILRQQEELKHRVESNPTALSAKKARIVTRPDVERALYLWFKHFNEEKGEVATGAMLEAKRLEFEKLLDVPEEERLTGRG